jgi:hypothetical protein
MQRAARRRAGPRHHLEQTRRAYECRCTAAGIAPYRASAGKGTSLQVRWQLLSLIHWLKRHSAPAHTIGTVEPVIWPRPTRVANRPNGRYSRLFSALKVGLAADPARIDVAGRGLCQHGVVSVRVESFTSSLAWRWVFFGRSMLAWQKRYLRGSHSHLWQIALSYRAIRGFAQTVAHIWPSVGPAALPMAYLKDSST